jgi:hypothetical protein
LGGRALDPPSEIAHLHRLKVAEGRHFNASRDELRRVASQTCCHFFSHARLSPVEEMSETNHFSDLSDVADKRWPPDGPAHSPATTHPGNRHPVGEVQVGPFKGLTQFFVTINK